MSVYGYKQITIDYVERVTLIFTLATEIANNCLNCDSSQIAEPYT